MPIDRYITKYVHYDDGVTETEKEIAFSNSQQIRKSSEVSVGDTTSLYMLYISISLR